MVLTDVYTCLELKSLCTLMHSPRPVGFIQFVIQVEMDLMNPMEKLDVVDSLGLEQPTFFYQANEREFARRCKELFSELRTAEGNLKRAQEEEVRNSNFLRILQFRRKRIQAENDLDAAKEEAKQRFLDLRAEAQAADEREFIRRSYSATAILESSGDRWPFSYAKETRWLYHHRDGFVVVSITEDYDDTGYANWVVVETRVLTAGQFTAAERQTALRWAESVLAAARKL